MNKKTYALILIPAAIACGIIIDQVRPISPEELGIDLVHNEQCEKAKLGINVFGENVGWSPEMVNNACTPLKGVLTEKERQEEQADLRSLYNSKGKVSDRIWELSRDTTELLMMSRRLHRSH